MDAPPEGNLDAEIEEELTMPADMSSALRRHYLQEMGKALPAHIQNRIESLKNLQVEHMKIEAEFFDEVHELEKKYQLKYQPLFEKRRAIVEGTVDPARKEPEHPVDMEPPRAAKGIPGFWLTVFRITPVLSSMVQRHDEPAMVKLTDISVKYGDGHSYTLEFRFGKNDYFTNSVLTKQYFLKSAVDPEDPFAFEGPEICKCTGCPISWVNKMNLTVKSIRKRQKHKEHGAMRTIRKQVPTDSFFNFFSPPKFPTGNEEIDDRSRLILSSDFKIAHLLRAKIIPKAVLYFTGDVVDGTDEEDEEEDEEFDESEDDE